MIPADRITRAEWRAYERLNEEAHADYSCRVSNHGPDALPHPCRRVECSRPNRTFRKWRAEDREAA